MELKNVIMTKRKLINQIEDKSISELNPCDETQEFDIIRRASQPTLHQNTPNR